VDLKLNARASTAWLSPGPREHEHLASEVDVLDPQPEDGRSARLSGCEACLLEHELFVPARRRQAAPAFAQR